MRSYHKKLLFHEAGRGHGSGVDTRLTDFENERHRSGKRMFGAATRNPDRISSAQYSTVPWGTAAQ